MELHGWSNPGRYLTETLFKQIYGILNYLIDENKVMSQRWNPDLQSNIGKEANINTANTVRHIIGLMKSVGIINQDGLIRGEVPKSEKFLSNSGKVFFHLMSMRNMAEETNNKEVKSKIDIMIQKFFAHALLYWYAKDSKVHVARTILKALSKYQYLDKYEWFILNTYIYQTDNLKEELQAYNTIDLYRKGEITFSPNDIESNLNSFQYWTQILEFARYINKSKAKIYLNNQNEVLVNEILKDDYLQQLNTKEKYNLSLGD